MTPERWQQIDQLFHETLACELALRDTFLAAACETDDALRVEIESLLSSHEDAEHFIETPAGDVAAELLGSNKTTFKPGHKIDNYRIVRLLGRGGMGEVYLADDTRLNRKVALKLLPQHYTSNPDRVRRFEREARTASGLNHPNIVTIYEIGKSGSVHFIATEFVDGKTLRQMIAERPFKLSETLNVAIQVSDALVGAHAAGIVHRDVKPENIMVRSDGYVKILDFGLAKLTEQSAPLEIESETPTLLQSNPGLVMGTVQYMSPEQARGKRVDGRTDIWSLGIVMYELLAGRVPFTGETPSHVMVSLMEAKLPPLNEHADVPADLDRFVTKALRKNQKERYHTAGELARDLKDFKQRLHHDSRSEEFLKSIPSRRKQSAQLTPLGAVAAPSEAVDTAPATIRATSIAEYLVREIKTHRTLALVVLVILVLGVVGLRYTFRNRASSNSSSLRAAQVPTPRGTTNDEAYRDYQQGKNLVNQRNQVDAKRAIDYFQEAIRLDPNYAQPYAGLASAYFSVGAGSSKSEEAVEKALQLDGNLAEAYAIRGFIRLTGKWDFTSAEKDLVHAIELEPNNDTAHWVYAFLLAETSRFDQGIKEIERAQAIAPGTHAYERDRGRILFYARRYDEAIIQFKRAIELQPDSNSAFSWMERAYEMKGDQAGAFESFIRWRELKHAELVEEYRQAYASGGWLAVKRKLLDNVKHGKDYPNMDAYEIAWNLLVLDETDEAFSYLNKSVDKREWEVVQLNVDPYLDPIRSDPRFTELLKRANFR